MVQSSSCIDLPPGFRFHPTDEEIIAHYLTPKILNPRFASVAIGDVDLNKCEPWDLPSKAKMGEKEWYFFCQRDRKYPTGMRTNRATESGYWKATGKDKEIFRGKSILVGMKKTLVFYRGRAPKGEKTNWVMHEFRLEGKPSSPNLPKSSKDEWVVCRVFHKNNGMRKIQLIPGIGIMSTTGEEFLDSPAMASLMEPQCFNPNTFIGQQQQQQQQAYFTSLLGIGMGMDTPPATISMNNSLLISPSDAFFKLPRYPPPPIGACKAEQVSNASQDTGYSTDRNTEISSVHSKHEIGVIDDLDSSNGAMMDLENMWKY